MELNLQDISERTQIDAAAPEKKELQKVMKKLKNGKSANDIPIGYIKCALENEELQIGSSLCKIMVVVIIERIKKWYESQLLDQQQGFRTGRGTIDGIYNLKRVHNITDSMKKPVYLLFVDLSAAIDHVERSWLFLSISKMMKNQNGVKLFELLQSLYSRTTTALAQTPDDKFDVKCGVRQGGPESPLPYNLLMDYVMRVYLEECDKGNISFLKLKYNIPDVASHSEIASVGSIHSIGSAMQMTSHLCSRMMKPYERDYIC